MKKISKYLASIALFSSAAITNATDCSFVPGLLNDCQTGDYGGKEVQILTSSTTSRTRVRVEPTLPFPIPARGRLHQVEASYHHLNWKGFDLTKPVKVRALGNLLGTDSVLTVEAFIGNPAAKPGDPDYKGAFQVLMEAIPGLTFELDNVQGVAGPYDNRLLFAELENRTGSAQYVAANVGAKMGASGFLCHNASFTFNAGQGIDDLVFNVVNPVSGACDNRFFDTGIIAFDPAEIRLGFGENVPIQAQKHLIIHEFLHLIGLGHFDTRSTSDDQCDSIMVENLFRTGCGFVENPESIPTELSVNDQIALDAYIDLIRADISTN